LYSSTNHNHGGKQARAKFGDDDVKVYASRFVNLYYGPWSGALVGWMDWIGLDSIRWFVG
jgi:hypothetical protein